MSRRKRQPANAEVSEPQSPERAPDLAAAVKAEVAKAMVPKPRPGRRCDFCGGYIEPKGGNNYASGWACSWCTRYIPSEGLEGDVLDFAASRLVGMPEGHRRLGSGDLIALAPKMEKGDAGYRGKRWGHVDVADLRARWQARYGAVPQDEAGRMRAAIVVKQQMAESARRLRSARSLKAQRDMARAQRRLQALAQTNGQAMVRP